MKNGSKRRSSPRWARSSGANVLCLLFAPATVQLSILYLQCQNNMVDLPVIVQFNVRTFFHVLFRKSNFPPVNL